MGSGAREITQGEILLSNAQKQWPSIYSKVDFVTECSNEG